MGNTVLIAGASGVIGAGAVGHFARRPGWRVIALSRRPPVVPAGCPFIPLPIDLADKSAVEQAVAALPGITHCVYTAVAEAPGLAAGWRDTAIMQQNAAMFANLLGPLARSGTLRHVSLLQGAKAYGAHLHGVTVPLREDAPRDAHANFYWLQEDALREASAASGFAFTVWRPQVLLGTAPGAAMNPVAAIGAYAMLCRERGQPFAMPGCGSALWELVDTDLMAEALAWAAETPAAAGQTFNITNGDIFVLEHAWPALADSVGLPLSETALPDLATFFADPESQLAWAALAARYGLAQPSLDRLLGQSHHYVDLLTARRIADKISPVLLSTIKLRQAGFSACRDSLVSLKTQLHKMVELRLLPPLLQDSGPGHT